ncbi:MAG: hypothetical protein CVU17_01345 [Betaproteobacteria bacterium HGW-Betaproteobacteria-11]|nr:MAG: hypothetical protein CVU17_01345 [Betaproteobacteria bacterium HGW-Betaproteobacteria-11]
MTPEAAQPTGERVLERLCAEAARYGVDLPGLAWATARFELQRDPLTGRDALLSRWRCESRNVQLLLRPDGYVYGECDLLADHPTRPELWMDVLAVWGMPAALKCEPNLIMKPV